MIKQRIRLPAVVLAASLGLAACGGGGGASGVPSLPAPPDSALLGVSANNYQEVGRAAVSSAFYLGETGGTLTGGQGGGARLLGHVADVARRTVLEARGQAARSAPLDLRQTFSCSQGGSLVLSISDANGNGNVDVGDAVDMEARACKEDDTLLQGRIGLSMKALTGVFYGNSFSATLGMTLTAFSTTRGNNTVQGDGSLELSLTQSPAGVSEVTLATPRLALSGTLDGQPFSTTLTDVKLSLRIEPQSNGGEKSSLSYSGGLASSRFGDQQVLITTRLPLEAAGSDANPSNGQLMVKGRGNSTLRITPVSASQARLEVDADGDGVYETQVLKTWAELR